MSNRSLGSYAALLLGLSIAHPSLATTISIDNVDLAGVGFNDPTVVAPVGGNAGTTLGQQRLNVFQQAANQWAALLQSSVPIIVQASMPNTLTCTATSATLGSAGPIESAHDFPGAPRANTAYGIAEANSLAGFDIDSGSSDDIQAQFNSKLDEGLATCLGGEKWWYGTDPSVPPAANTIPLLPVVFHELGHGLGFISFVSTTTGNFLTSQTPVWADYLFDTSSSLLWKNMSSAQRLTSTTNDPNLVWTGPRTNKQAGEYLKNSNALIISSPSVPPLGGAQEVGTATFGPAVPAGGVSGSLVLVNDGGTSGGSTITDGCDTPFVNAASVNGKIAVMDRGLCNFTVKVKNAQTNGAIAAIIINNVVDDLRLPLTMPGTDATITIPSYSVTMALGALIKPALGTGVTAKLGYANIGINQGCVRMFAPTPVLSGSSVSHFHADAFPDLLMEPALNTSIFNKVDLTLPLFIDIDWKTNLEDFIFIDGMDPNPCAHVQP